MISFLDTNIWVYANVKDESNTEKNRKTIQLLENLKTNSRIILSIQVINEFHWVLQRKYKQSDEIIHTKVNAIIQIADIQPISLNTYLSAYELRKQYSLSFWDSLLLASAIENNVEQFYTENFQNLLMINKLKIINPYSEN